MLFVLKPKTAEESKHTEQSEYCKHKCHKMHNSPLYTLYNMQNEAANITIALSQSFQVLSIYTESKQYLTTIIEKRTANLQIRFSYK